MTYKLCTHRDVHAFQHFQPVNACIEVLFEIDMFTILKEFCSYKCTYIWIVIVVFSNLCIYIYIDFIYIYIKYLFSYLYLNIRLFNCGGEGVWDGMPT